MPLQLLVVDWDALLQTAWASIAAGLGITLAFSVAIYGAVRTVELRRDERPIAASLAATLMLLGLAVSVAAIVFGVIVMTTK
jgi:hypothetical protein